MLRIAIWDDQFQKQEEAVVWNYEALTKSILEIMFEIDPKKPFHTIYSSEDDENAKIKIYERRKNDKSNSSKKEGQKKQKAD